MLPANFLVRFLVALAVSALLIGAYSPGLEGGFFFDDEANILLPEGIRLEIISSESIRDAVAAGKSGPSGRPVSVLSFALNYYLSGFDPFAFKATNLAIHAVNGLLVFLLALRLLASSLPATKQHKALIAAGFLATLWLLHPIQLLPVLHAAQRMTSLSALFLFAALLLHMRARERRSRASAIEMALAWGVLWPLSFFSKESGVLFPFFALAWELIVRCRVQGGLDRFARRFAVLAGLTLAAGAIYALLPAGQWLWAGYRLRDFTLSERLLTEGRVLWFYLGLMALPRLEALGLYHDDIPLSTGLFEPWATIPALLGLAGLCLLAWRFRKSMPLVSFGVAWFFVGHALESTVLPLEIAHEHRNYVPLFGFLLAAAALLARALEAGGSRRTVGLALAAVSLLYFPFVTALRAHQFGEDGRRTQIEAQHHRGSARAQYEAGLVLAKLPDSALPDSPSRYFARVHYEMAGELDPSLKPGLVGLIHLDCRAGLPVEPAQVDELARRLQETPFAPGDSTMMYVVKEMTIAGSLCLARPEVERLFAAARANPAVSPPVRSLLHSWLADYLTLGARDLPAAVIELERALAITPHKPSDRLKRAQLDFLLGRFAEATRRLDELRDASLARSDREILAELRACLASDNPSAQCAGR